MKPVRIASSLALGCMAVLAVSAVRAEPRAVLELFTSQGCSSCPAADKVLGELSQDPSLVAITLAVDYWDYLGWKDTLALKGHTARQRAYAGVRGDREVYTPQLVVNGVMHVNGANKAAIEHAIAHTRNKASALTLPVSVSVADDKLHVTLPSKDGQPAAEVWLCPTTKSVNVKIGRGENRGNTITYTNVARRWVKLGEWDGKAQTLSIPLKDLQTGDIDQVTVLVQTGASNAPKIMLGAAQIAVR
jgi:hypothetical protein